MTKKLSPRLLERSWKLTAVGMQKGVGLFEPTVRIVPLGLLEAQ